MQVEKLNSFEKDELLRWFLYWMPIEKRRDLIKRYPLHYKKLLSEKELRE